MKQTSGKRITKEIRLNSLRAIFAHGCKNIRALKDASHSSNLIYVDMFSSRTTPPVVYDFHITLAV